MIIIQEHVVCLALLGVIRTRIKPKCLSLKASKLSFNANKHLSSGAPRFSSCFFLSVCQHVQVVSPHSHRRQTHPPTLVVCLLALPVSYFCILFVVICFRSSKSLPVWPSILPPVLIAHVKFLSHPVWSLFPIIWTFSRLHTIKLCTVREVNTGICY